VRAVAVRHREVRGGRRLRRVVREVESGWRSRPPRRLYRRRGRTAPSRSLRTTSPPAPSRATSARARAASRSPRRWRTYKAYATSSAAGVGVVALRVEMALDVAQIFLSIFERLRRTSKALLLRALQRVRHVDADVGLRQVAVVPEGEAAIVVLHHAQAASRRDPPPHHLLRLLAARRRGNAVRTSLSAATAIIRDESCSEHSNGYAAR